uniref:Uncharacterized protein n=1 Tax=Aegilops tauschii subsp. strangulata TaxID=200361 RepID=A0A453QVB9_AEGTS
MTLLWLLDCLYWIRVFFSFFCLMDEEVIIKSFSLNQRIRTLLYQLVCFHWMFHIRV